MLYQYYILLCNTSWYLFIPNSALLLDVLMRYPVILYLFGLHRNFAKTFFNIPLFFPSPPLTTNLSLQILCNDGWKLKSWIDNISIHNNPYPWCIFTESTLYSNWQALPGRADGISQQTEPEQSQSWRNRDGPPCYEGETQERHSQQRLWCESHIITHWPQSLNKMQLNWHN